MQIDTTFLDRRVATLQKALQLLGASEKDDIDFALRTLDGEAFPAPTRSA